MTNATKNPAAAEKVAEKANTQTLKLLKCVIGLLLVVVALGAAAVAAPFAAAEKYDCDGNSASSVVSDETSVTQKDSACENLSEFTMDTFMSGMMLTSTSLDDMMSTMQAMTDNTFMLNGEEYSMDSMVAVNIMTEDAAVMVDGVELTPEEMPPSTVFTLPGADGASTVMITTSFDGAVESVIEMDSQGATKSQMQAVTPGCLVSITPEMVDQEKLDQFILADSASEDPTSDGNQTATNTTGTTSANNVRRNLQTCGSNDKVVEVAFGADSSFCSKFGGRWGAIAKINKIVSIANMLFQVPGLCTKIRVKFCDIQCTQATDRYRASVLEHKSGCGDDGLLQAAKFLWKNDAALAGKRGDATHIFTAESFECNADGRCIVGCAFDDQVCNVGNAFGVNNIGYSSDERLQANLFAHELGHNLVSAHLSSLPYFSVCF